MKNAQQAASNYQASAGRAQSAFVQGVQSTTKDQAALAVAAEARLLQGFTNAVTSGQWRQGVMRGGTAYWKAQTEAKASNYSTGIAAGGNNYAAAAQKIIAAIGNIVPNLPPRGDVNANIQRSGAFALAMHQLKGQLGAR